MAAAKKRYRFSKGQKPADGALNAHRSRRISAPLALGQLTKTIRPHVRAKGPCRKVQSRALPKSPGLAISTLTRRIRSPCCARAASGHAAAPPSSVMNESASSLDHLVGAGKHGCRNVETQRLRGLEIDRQLELGRCLYGKVSRLLAFEDAIDVAGRASILVREIGPI